MLDITDKNINMRVKDEIINKNSRVDVSKKRQKNNIDPDDSTLSISKINSIPFDDLQNRMTSIQVAREGLENSVGILEKMKDLVYSDKENGIESLNKKKFDLLKNELNTEKEQIENSIKELRSSNDNKLLNERINNDNAKTEKAKKGHLEFIKSLKSVPDLNSIHKGLTAEKVASLLS